MKFILFSLLIVLVFIGAYAAPKKDKSTKTCPQCRLKGKDTYNPVCGKLNGIVRTFDSESIFYCFAKCREVDHELLSYNACVPTTQAGIIFKDTTTSDSLDYPIDVREGYEY